jgi:hypothetical protein
MQKDLPIPVQNTVNELKEEALRWLATAKLKTGNVIYNPTKNLS